MQPSGIEASDAATEVMNEERASAAQLEDSGERPSSASSSASGSDSGSETVAEVTGARWMRAPPAPADDVPLTRRYEPRELLGEGGMGEVHRCTDARIGREVAMKVMRHADEPGSSTKRFRREALLQANLEHPSIVPVYDVGVDAEGAPCFAMKRVRGQTLRHILTRIAEGDELARRRYPVHKLLGAFSQVCLAIDFAHSRGVIHRDLKPANIMLGDFGEVYVLDWGLAKIMGLDDCPTPVMFERRGAHHTGSGARLGTAGYMSPEQIRGEPIDAKTDVYGLGSILFEILTRSPLHEGDREQRIASTLVDFDASSVVRQRRPDIAPELAAVVARAVAFDPAARFPTPRALQEAIEAFLAGDRDVERRRELAAEHATRAVEAAKRSRAARGAGESDDRRAALHEVGRALALDPANVRARQTLVDLLTDPPAHAPPEVEVQLRDDIAATRRSLTRSMVIAAVGWFAFIPFWFALEPWPFALTVNALWGLSIALALKAAGQSGPFRVLAAISWTATLMVLGRLYGPFLIVPGIATLMATTFSMYGERWERWLGILLGIGAIAVPSGLEWVGVLTPVMTIADHGTTLHLANDGHGMLSIGVLVLANVVLVAMPALLLSRFTGGLVEAKRRELLRAWQVHHLVPHDHRASRP